MRGAGFGRVRPLTGMDGVHGGSGKQMFVRGGYAPAHRGHRVELLECRGGVCVHACLRGFTGERGQMVPGQSAQ